MNKESWIDIPCVINGTKIVLTVAKDASSKDIESALQLICSTGGAKNGEKERERKN